MSTTPDVLRAALADRYRIERELGAGGMATVYLAEDVRHRRKVALKVLRPVTPSTPVYFVGSTMRSTHLAPRSGIPLQGCRDE